MLHCKGCGDCFVYLYKRGSNPLDLVAAWRSSTCALYALNVQPAFYGDSFFLRRLILMQQVHPMCILSWFLKSNKNRQNSHRMYLLH
jgi:hypothetical protein